MSMLRFFTRRCQCPICGESVAAAGGGDPVGPCSHCGHLIWFRIQEFGNTVVINLLPAFDRERSDIRRVGELVLRQLQTPRIVVNLALVPMIGSTVLDRLVLLKRSITAAGGSLVLCGMNSVVQEVFAITHLDGYFEISDSPNGDD